MTATILEFELRLAGAPGDVRRAIESAAISNAPASAHASERVVSTYFDDARGTLARNGVSLRIRKDCDGEAIVIKQSTDESGSRRIEIARPASRPIRFSPTGIATLDAVIASAAPLRRVGRVACDRVSVQIYWEGATIELAADIGEARFGPVSRAISEVEIELVEGPECAAFALARAMIENAEGRLHLRLARKAEAAARIRARLADADRATSEDAQRSALLRASVNLERSLAMLERRRPKSIKLAARALRRIVDASDLWGADDERMSALAADARANLHVFQRGLRLRRLSRAHATINFGAILAEERGELFQFTRSTGFGVFRILLLETALRAPASGGGGSARLAAISALDQHWSAVSSANCASERSGALARLASAARASASLFPKDKRRAFRRLLRSAISAQEAANEAQETCALAAEAAAGQGPAAARAAGFIAGSAAAEAAARIADAPHACEALLAAPRYWREER